MMKVIFENWRRFLKEEEIIPSSDFPDFSIEKLEQTLNNLNKLSQKPFLYFDTETLGFSPQLHQITQLSYKIIKNEQIINNNSIMIMLDKDTERKMEKKKRWIEEENVKRGGIPLSWLDQPNQGPDDPVENTTTDEEKQKDYINTKWISYNDKKFTLLSKNNLISREQVKKFKTLSKKQLSFELNNILNNLSADIKQEIEKLLQELKDELFSPERILKFTNWNKQKAEEQNISEQKALTEFANLMKLNPVLVAHNMRFDVNMINERSKINGMEPPIDKNTNTFLDTLEFSKQIYVPAIEAMKKKVDDLLADLNKNKSLEEIEDDVSTKDREKFRKDLTAQVRSLGSGEDPKSQKQIQLTVLSYALENAIPIKQEIEKLEQKEKDSLNKAAEAKKTKISHTQGDIARSLKIDASRAHEAEEDVIMLVEILKQMITSIRMIITFLKTGKVVVNEVKEFQKNSKIRRNKQMKTLLNHGGNKDKLKPGNSAPPGLPGGY